jgi:hypothetical protein
LENISALDMKCTFRRLRIYFMQNFSQMPMHFLLLLQTMPGMICTDFGMDVVHTLAHFICDKCLPRYVVFPHIITILFFLESTFLIPYVDTISLTLSQVDFWTGSE